MSLQEFLIAVLVPAGDGMLLGYATSLRQDNREMEVCNALLAAENLRLTARLHRHTSLALGSEQ